MYVIIVNLLPQRQVLTHNEVLKSIDKHPHDFQSFILFLSENELFEL